MPVITASSLPARRTLDGECIWGSDETQLPHGIRPLQIAILNLMPTKIATETQLLRLLGNTPLPVVVTLLHTCSHRPKHTPAEHLLAHYLTFEQVQDRRFDGLVVTGAPVEHLDFEEVDYWTELAAIFDWASTHAGSTFHICWAAQAGLYHRYGIPKHPLPEKLFGVFPHHLIAPSAPLLSGFDDIFYAPHSRHTTVLRADLEVIPELHVLAESDEAGVYIAASRDRRQVYVTGHSEYDPATLKHEYERDLKKSLPIRPPKNYFPGNDASQTPRVQWRGHANLLFANWLNYYVYPSNYQGSPGSQR